MPAKTTEPVAVEGAPVAPKSAKTSSSKSTSTKASSTTKSTTAKTTTKRVTTAKKTTTKKKTPPKDTTKRILMVASEGYPFAGSGGLGDVIGSLPTALCGGDYDVRVILPLYQSMPAELRATLQFVGETTVKLSWREQYCGLFRATYQGVTYYFVDNEYYFKRPELYGHFDDGERFAFFSKAVLDLLPMLDFAPDVLHCHDWQTALVPIYYKLYYMYNEQYSNIRTVFTIHNIEYQGKYPEGIIADVFGIDHGQYHSIEHDGCINLMKGALDYCDYITTVSPTYADELKIPFYAHGLDGVMCRNNDKLRGIINGIDASLYDPATQSALFANYDLDYKVGKAINKAEMQKMAGLPVKPNVPVIALVSRLVTHKGLDLVRGAMEDILDKDVQILLLGKGDYEYEQYFRYVRNIHPDKFGCFIEYDKTLSHRVYASADMFLMPSKSEPCGLSQMMASLYGTVAIVRATGGLKDSIIDACDGDSGNGYTFYNYSEWDMLHAISRAVGLYYDYPDKWEGLVRRAMTTDFSWSKSASQYIAFYDSIIGNK